MFKNISIQNKLLIAYMCMTGIVLALAFAIVSKINSTSSQESVISSLNVLAEIVAGSSVASLAFTDSESASNNLNSLKSHNSISYACITTVGGGTFVEYNRESEADFKCDNYKEARRYKVVNGYVYISKQIKLEGRSIGELQIISSLSELTEATVKSAKISAMIFIGLMLLTALISRRLMRIVSGPILRLKDVALSVSRSKDYSLRMKKTTGDEVGVLIGAFNNMLDQIQLRDSALIEEKEKAELAALSAKRYAQETELMNKDMENEIRERARIEGELHELNETLEDKVNERTSELKELNEKIGDIARSAGMAEVASGVLHNVGNVLNSVNVSASVLREKVRKTKATNMEKVVAMLDENSENIAGFIGNDVKGKQIPKYLSLLSEQLAIEKTDMLGELDALMNNIDHIKNVISMQQSYAGSYGIQEELMLSDLVEDAIRINVQGMELNGVKIIREYKEIPKLYVDKHKVLQIIINIISNAKHALLESESKIKNLIINIRKDSGVAKIEIMDTGVGIDKADMQHLFEYGFKKRRDGHGFGLHHSALVANELNGKIEVRSDGLGKGACFTLQLPIDEKSEQ